jgi:recombination protein RecT
MSQNQITVKQFFAKDAVKSKFEELLGKKANGFVTSVLQVVNNNNLLQKATPESVYNCAAVAATLDLPINNSLGFAWIVPYGGQAQFQIGWKGLVQLANRTGQYKAINVVEVYENQFKSFNRLTEELDADFTQEPSGKIVGYVAYFKLLNGFEKTSYWSVADVEKHAKRFSKTYGGGVWKSDFDAMAKKTVLKNTLSKWGILSIEMQTATIADQAVIKDAETLDVEYIDASEPNAEQLPLISDEGITELLGQGATLAQIQTTYTVTDEQLLKFG